MAVSTLPISLSSQRIWALSERLITVSVQCSKWFLSLCGRLPAVHVAWSAALIAPALPIEDARPLGLSSLPVFTDPLGVYPVCFSEIPLLLAKARTRLALARWIGNPALRTVNIQSLS